MHGCFRAGVCDAMTRPDQQHHAAFLRAGDGSNVLASKSGVALANSGIRVLVVEDHRPFRRFISSILQQRSGLQIIGEVSNGLEAVQQAEELQPDLILVDIGLPLLNGIEAARRIRKITPDSRILFLTLESSPHIVQEVLNLGAQGYVLKAQAGSELLPAIEAVIQGKQFVSSAFKDHVFGDIRAHGQFYSPDVLPSLAPTIQNPEIVRRHPVQFYSDDQSFLDRFTRFITDALNEQNGVIVVATESHRRSLLQRLQAAGEDVAAAVEQKHYIPLDVADSLPTFMVDGSPEPVRFGKDARDLIVEVAEAAKERHRQVAVG